MSRSGIPLALLSAFLFGASTPLAKLLLGTVNPWLMAGLLYLGAGIGLAAVHLSRSALQIPAAEAPLRRSDVPWLGLVILAGGVGGPLLLMFGLARTTAHRRLFLPCPLRRCGVGRSHSRRAPDRKALDRRAVHGPEPMAASG